MNRREFLKASLAGGTALVLGVQFVGCASPQVRRMQSLFENEGTFQPNAFLTLTPDDRVLVAVAQTEMGQGVFTSQAMLVAEELEVDLDKVEVFHPKAGPDFTFFGVQMTGGSTSVVLTYRPIREAAATAREMLIAAAARQWDCPPEQCYAKKGSVYQKETERSVPYRDLLELASAERPPRRVTLKEQQDFQVLKKKAPRVDSLDKVTGKAPYGMDVLVPGMVKALVIRPDVLGSKVKSFDGQEARKEPGVIAIFSFSQGVAVVAEKYWQARRAAPLITVEWEAGPLQGFESSRLEAQARERIETPGLRVRNTGNVDRLFGDSSLRQVEALYEAPYLAHAPLEPQNATVWVQEDRCQIWAPVQWPSAVSADVADLLGLRRDQVEVQVEMPGGGFGRRLVHDYVIEAVLISKEVGRPVQVIWSREDDTRGGYYRPYSLTKVKAAIDEEGRPQGFYYHNMSQSLLDLRDWLPGLLPGWLPRVSRVMLARAGGDLVDSGTLPEALATEGAIDMTYEIPHRRIEHTAIRVDVPITFWRAVGHSYNGFVMESFIDELAYDAGLDPLEYRRSLLKSDPRKLAVLDRVAELSRWKEARLESPWGRGIAVHKSFNTYCAQVIEAAVIDGEIKIRKVYCVVDCGVALNPDIVKAQMESGILQGLSAALFQKIDFEAGRVVQGNFDDFPFLRLHQSPSIEVEVLSSSESPTGVGEPGLPPAAPALANAIFAATGIRLRTMPFEKALARSANVDRPDGGHR